MTQFNGKLYLILGCMFASKTSQLLSYYNKNKLAGKKCVMIKYINDTRYDANTIVTHDQIKNEAIACKYLYEFDDLATEFDVICIDEVQFYKDAHIFCDKWANQGKIIFACGLNGTFNRTPFDVISKLIPLVDNIIFLKAICKETGKNAIFSNLDIGPIAPDRLQSDEIIGGSEKYNAVDRKTYFQTNNNISMLYDFLKIYFESQELKFDQTRLNENLIVEWNGLNYMDIIKKIDFNNIKK